MTSHIVRPLIEELRLGAFKSYRRTVLPLAPLTVLHGPAAVGKSNALDALAVLSRLALGEAIGPALDGGGSGPLAEPVRGGLAGCVPHGRSAFTLGCTVRTASGPIRLDVVVRTDGGARIARERLTCDGEVLLETGERDPARGRINVTWRNDTRQGDIKAPFPSESLITAQVPLRVAGASVGERKVLAAAEQMLTALREIFPADPAPARMRGWVVADPGSRLTGSAVNVSAVLARLRGECRHRYGRLVKALREAAPHPLLALDVERRDIEDGEDLVMAVFDEGRLGRTTAERASYGLLRYLAFAAVLLTGAEVLDIDPAGEVPWERRLLTVAAYDPGAGLAPGQVVGLLRLAREMCGSGHVRVLTALQDPAAAREAGGAVLVECARDLATGCSVLRPETARVAEQLPRSPQGCGPAAAPALAAAAASAPERASGGLVR
jgi:hypothetical protein